MEPLKISIEVSLSSETLDVLKALIGPDEQPGFDIPEKKTKEGPEPQPDPKPEKKATKPAGTSPAGAGAEDDDDLPADDAPSPRKAAPAPTEADARAAVKAAKDRGVTPKAIRSFMQDSFGITSSVDCPEERRQELIDGLNRLAA